MAYCLWILCGKNRDTQKDKRSQHNNSHGHLPPYVLSPLYSSPHLCVSFDQFLSCCCSDPLGIEVLFESHSWLEVLVILLVSKIMMLGWSFWLSEFPWKALLFYIFVYCCLIRVGKKQAHSFLRPKHLPFTTSGSRLVQSPATCSSLLPPHFFSCYLRNSTLCSWQVRCNLLMILLPVYGVECCLTWSGEKGVTSWF